MEKEILIQNLRTKLGEDKSCAISDRTMESFVEDWLPDFADDSKITDESWNFPIKVLTNYAGQKLHDDAEMTSKLKKEYEEKLNADLEKKIEEAKEAAIAQYIKEHPITDPKATPTPPQNKKMEDIVAEQVAAAMANLTKEDGVIGKLNNTISSFITRNEEKERAQAIDSVKKRLSAYLVERGANSTPAIEDALLDIEYGDNPNFDELKSKVVPAYESRFKRYFGDGAKPFGGGANGNPNGLTDDVKEHIEKLKQEAQQNANYRESITKNFV